MSMSEFFLEHVFMPWVSSEQAEMVTTGLAILLLITVLLEAFFVFRNKMTAFQYNHFSFILLPVQMSIFFGYFFWYISVPVYCFLSLLFFRMEKIGAKKALYNHQHGVDSFRLDDLVKSGIINDDLSQFHPSDSEIGAVCTPRRISIPWFACWPFLLIGTLALLGFGYRFF